VLCLLLKKKWLTAAIPPLTQRATRHILPPQTMISFLLGRKASFMFCTWQKGSLPNMRLSFVLYSLHGCRSRNELNFLRHIENYSEFFKDMELKAERLKEPLRELFKNTYILEGSDNFVKAFDRAIDNFNDLVYGSLKLLDIIHGDDMRNNFLTWRNRTCKKWRIIFPWRTSGRRK
jgi:hypothetical protein